ncbi:MAG: hypothetical protein R3C18_18430 [Planctomycetaceae bacterium]
MSPQKIIDHVKNGRLTQLLIGEGEFFQMNHTYRQHHDVLSILGSLYGWSHANPEFNFPDLLEKTLLEVTVRRPEVTLNVMLAHRVMRKHGTKVVAIDERFVLSHVKKHLAELKIQSNEFGVSLEEIFERVESLRD